MSRRIQKPKSKPKTKKQIIEEARKKQFERDNREREKLKERYTARDPDDILQTRKDILQIRRLQGEVRGLTSELMESRTRAGILKQLAVPMKAIKRREKKSKHNEGTAVILASDWHIESTVDPAKVNGVNGFNPEICEQRVARFIHGIRSLLEVHRAKTKITDVVLAFIGDMINGFIHLEFRQSNSESPPFACRRFKHLAIWVIDSLLEDPKIEKLSIPCTIGNHGRIDQRKPAGTAVENSFEWMVYADLADHYRDDPRVSVGVPRGLVTYLDVYDFTLRFEHGDSFGFQGGIGGVFIPFNKHIARRDRLRPANITHIGHWHQLKMLKHAIINGSLIGYDEYADSRGFDFEHAAQGFYLLDSKQGPHSWSPIWVQRADDVFIDLRAEKGSRWLRRSVDAADPRSRVAGAPSLQRTPAGVLPRTWESWGWKG